MERKRIVLPNVKSRSYYFRNHDTAWFLSGPERKFSDVPSGPFQRRLRCPPHASSASKMPLAANVTVFTPKTTKQCHPGRNGRAHRRSELRKSAFTKLRE